MLDDFEEVSAGGWAKLTNKGDLVRGMFTGYFIQPAREQFGEQIVATLEGEDGSVTNVGLPTSNPKYANGIKKLTPGHDVIITLEGFWNSDKGEMVDESGKTKKMKSFAKSYSIRQSKSQNPKWMQSVADSAFDNVPDAPF